VRREVGRSLLGVGRSAFALAAGDDCGVASNSQLFNSASFGFLSVDAENRIFVAE